MPRSMALIAAACRSRRRSHTEEKNPREGFAGRKATHLFQIKNHGMILGPSLPGSTFVTGQHFPENGALFHCVVGLEGDWFFTDTGGGVRLSRRSSSSLLLALGMDFPLAQQLQKSVLADGSKPPRNDHRCQLLSFHPPAVVIRSVSAWFSVSMNPASNCKLSVTFLMICSGLLDGVGAALPEGASVHR